MIRTQTCARRRLGHEVGGRAGYETPDSESESLERSAHNNWLAIPRPHLHDQYALVENSLRRSFWQPPNPAAADPTPCDRCSVKRLGSVFVFDLRHASVLSRHGSLPDTLQMH